MATNHITSEVKANISKATNLVHSTMVLCSTFAYDNCSDLEVARMDSQRALLQKVGALLDKCSQALGGGGGMFGPTMEDWEGVGRKG